MKYTFILENKESFRPGEKVLVISRRNILKQGHDTWDLCPEFASTGYPGNADSKIETFHGWRGTTNNIYVEAHGVYEIISVEPAKDNWLIDPVKVKIGRKDFAAALE